MGRLIRMPPRPGSEPWLSKRQIAAYFGFSTRWVEMRVRDGMPSEMFGGHRRFRASECEAWLLERGVA
jgi:excisionase family DNA binding protein